MEAVSTAAEKLIEKALDGTKITKPLSEMSAEERTIAAIQENVADVCNGLKLPAACEKFARTSPELREYVEARHRSQKLKMSGKDVVEQIKADTQAIGAFQRFRFKAENP